MTAYEELMNKGIDIYNSKSDYYNSLCIPLKLNDTSFTVQDRRYTFSNLSGGCSYQSLNQTTGYVNCICNSADTENEVAPEFQNILLGLFNETNFGIIDCYQTIFQLPTFFDCLGFINNICLIVLMTGLLIAYSQIDADIATNKEKIELAYKYEVKYFEKDMDPLEYFINGKSVKLKIEGEEHSVQPAENINPENKKNDSQEQNNSSNVNSESVDKESNEVSENSDNVQYSEVSEVSNRDNGNQNDITSIIINANSTLISNFNSINPNNTNNINESNTQFNQIEHNNSNINPSDVGSGNKNKKDADCDDIVSKLKMITSIKDNESDGNYEDKDGGGDLESIPRINYNHTKSDNESDVYYEDKDDDLESIPRLNYNIVTELNVNNENNYVEEPESKPELNVNNENN